MRVSAVLRLSLSALCGLALAGCVASPQAPRTAPKAPARPAPAAVQVPQTPPSAASEAVRQHFARVQADLLSNGLLRTDGGGRDTPFTDRMLAENFIRIALYDEYVRGAGGPIQRQTASRLRRWESPVRVGLRFGASVSPQARATDTARVRSYLARLSRLTSHPISLSDAQPNFMIYIVNEDERRALGPTVNAELPGLSAGELAGITNMPLSTYCLVYAMSEGNTGRYSRAFAVIRSEHPDLLRLSCMHEEIAQGLGLANDSPRARPSIFNDDEEFALLTRQDELMLRMLYNPALRTGMTESEARPIIESLARALLGGES
ncbi:DUF2927 domain-containing protein [Pseudorhodobacter sp. MZDSW-24AT]|uniref:DUF2927 domain-containing protein n=1 Tax=Pseudorhodobacter sp. MZDSW-24AT TaxID=2052957 RepID=UPI000C1F3255|nr:DUF2927 domain-containing protein [Pseudorhodobacter sp. MZDSW-24AT]PJF09104.1 hypothetical protein CUR21_11675 [Pseudorhodobacter sp. MZDSW-24AT]